MAASSSFLINRLRHLSSNTDSPSIPDLKDWISKPLCGRIVTPLNRKGVSDRVQPLVMQNSVSLYRWCNTFWPRSPDLEVAFDPIHVFIQVTSQSNDMPYRNRCLLRSHITASQVVTLQWNLNECVDWTKNDFEIRPPRPDCVTSMCPRLETSLLPNGSRSRPSLAWPSSLASFPSLRDIVFHLHGNSRGKQHTTCSRSLLSCAREVPNPGQGEGQGQGQ
jgi:hypothetical protein